MTAAPGKVFVVMGQAGEYSDRRDWPVAAYARREDADAHEHAAWARFYELKDWMDPKGEFWRWSDDPSRPTNQHDPGGDSFRTSGAQDYFVVEVPLFEGFTP